MKKTIITILFLLTVTSYLYSQKMNFNMANPRDSAGYFMYDLRVTVLTGQVWRVGASNIRLNDSIQGTGTLMPKGDAPAINANPNISNTGIYQQMTTTPINSNTGIGCNILTFSTSGFYTFQPGTYRLATLRWTKTPPISFIILKFRLPPSSAATVVYDSTVQLTYNTNFTITDPVIVSINNLGNELPKEYNLYQNYPNPFNPKTSLKFDLPKSSHVTLKIYDIMGKEIDEILNQTMEGGSYTANWDASHLASGVYFCRITAGDYKNTMRMVLIK
jgi:hypothetical protein